MYAAYDRLLRKLSPGWARSALILFVSWVHQGFLSLGRTDRIGKVLTEGLLAAPIFLLLTFAASIPLLLASLLSLSFAHMGNWVLNTNVHAARRAGGRFRTQGERLQTALEDVAHRLRRAEVAGVLLGGSGIEGRWGPTSDLDVHVVRRPGLWGSLRGFWAVLKERARAFFTVLPLDIYLEDPAGARWERVASGSKIIVGDRGFLRSLLVADAEAPDSQAR